MILIDQFFFSQLFIMNCLLLLTLSLSLVSVTDAGYSPCPTNTYFNTKIQACFNCSSCPVNEIIRKPCGLFDDILCGPFVEFQYFNHHQNRTNNHHHGPTIHHGIGNSNDNINSNHNGNIINNNNNNNRPNIINNNHNNNHNNKNRVYNEPRMNNNNIKPDLATTISHDAKSWRTIAHSLIGIICTICVILLLAVVIFVHFLKKRNPGYDKEVIYDSNESGMSEVCYSTMALDYMQKTRPSSALWMYTPAYHKSQDYLLYQYPEAEATAPFANNTDDGEECPDRDHHCTGAHTSHSCNNKDNNVVDYVQEYATSNNTTNNTGNDNSSGSTTNNSNNPINNTGNNSTNNTTNNGQSVCSCSNHFPDYVFFNLAQNEYLEK